MRGRLDARRTLKSLVADLRVFMLWGAYAKEKAALIDSSKHLILTTVHPSPRSAEYGFFGCRHFSKANDYLRSKGIKEIDW